MQHKHIWDKARKTALAINKITDYLLSKIILRTCYFGDLHFCGFLFIWDKIMNGWSSWSSVWVGSFSLREGHSTISLSLSKFWFGSRTHLHMKRIILGLSSRLTHNGIPNDISKSECCARVGLLPTPQITSHWHGNHRNYMGNKQLNETHITPLEP